MLDYFRLGDVYLHNESDPTLKRALSRVEGLVGVGGVRQAGRQKTEQHGSRPRNRFTDSKIVTLEGECWGDDIDDAFAEFDAVAAAVWDTLAADIGDAETLYEWQRGNAGLELRAHGKLAGSISPPLEEGAALLRYQVQVEQGDPRVYSQSLQTIVGAALTEGGGGLTFPLTFPFMFDPSSGGEAAITNGGRVETPLVIRVYGYVTSPRVVLIVSGVVVSEIVLTGEIAAGSYLEIDTATRAVRLNGDTLRMNLLDAGASEFFDAPAGASTVRLLGSNFDNAAHLEVELRDAYTG